MPTTSPDNIYFAGTDAAWSTTADLATLASSVQNALNQRQRFDYVWADATARGLQTGMVQNSRGYQTDTRTEYIYDNSAWRVNTPYAEFTIASTTIANSVFNATGTISIDATNSTSTTFATASGNTITMSDPGIYMVGIFGTVSLTGGAGFITTAIAADYATNFNSQIARAPFGNTDNVANSTGFYRFAASSGVFYFAVKQGDAASRTYNARIRIFRMG